MPNPSWVTAENVKFNGTLNSAVVLQRANNIKSLILWDSLSADDMGKLTDFITDHGGITPLITPTSGFQVCGFKSVVGATATGLSATASSVAGIATIKLGGLAISAGLTGLSNAILLKSHVARIYSAIVIIDGYIIKRISISGSNGNTFSSLLTLINASLGSTATATLSGGNIVITSATTGKSSSVLIQDTGFLCSSLAGYSGILYVAGYGPTTYHANAMVDGINIPISIVGSTAQTYTTLLSQINIDLGAAAIATIVGGNIVITSATAGVNSVVSIVDVNLFKSLTVFKSISTPIIGSANLLDTFRSTRSTCGAWYSDLFKIIAVGLKPAMPPMMVHGIYNTYWNGSVWKYLDTDVTV
jgi:hypothetical protein